MPAGRAPGRRSTGLKRRWKRFRKRLRASPALRAASAAGLHGFLALVHRTNPLVAGGTDPRAVMTGEPVIIALWHGRHFMVGFAAPPGVPVTALISRSADAELNAAVLERMGVETVRGSGGGARGGTGGKGGVGAFRALCRALERGRTVVMIADPQGRPREAGAGIVRLARASGRPVVAVAYSSSRVHLFERAWDRAALNLPFGRAAVVAAPPIHVPADADEAAMEEARRRLTAALDAATHEAGALAGAPHDRAPGRIGESGPIDASGRTDAPERRRTDALERTS